MLAPLPNCSMVGNLSRENNQDPGRRDQSSGNSRNQGDGIRVERNHNIDHNTIRRLIQGSLGPLIVDPVPTSVRIYNIVITKDNRDRLDIHCDVSYETVRRE